MTTQQLVTAKKDSDFCFPPRFCDDAAHIFDDLANFDSLPKPVVFYRQDFEDYANYYPSIKIAHRNKKIYLVDLSKAGGKNLQKMAGEPPTVCMHGFLKMEHGRKPILNKL